MKLTVSYILASTLFCFACGTSVSDIQAEKVAEPTSTAKQPEIEDFEAFFRRFTTDSVFQIERVDFPFYIQTSSEEGESKTVMEKTAWRFSTFHHDSSFATRQIDAYTQQLKSYNDSMRLELRGVDNGIYIDYDFVSRNGKWFMVSGRDYSN